MSSSIDQSNITRQNLIENIVDLEKSINSITKSLSRPYFNKILKDLARTNSDNAKTIVDYIIAEQTELNIKDSTKEGKIKVLVWLSNFLGALLHDYFFGYFLTLLDPYSR